VLLLRDGAVVALATISASTQGIDQILWVMRPSKLVAISLSLQASRERISSDLQLS
jgi:RNA polymerase sigma-70 factor, ECF subfamily